MIEARSLLNVPDVRHGFFTREGGFSRGLYAGLNCAYGTGDVAETVDRNRDHVATALGLERARLATPYQHHSADVVVVDEPWVRAEAPKADGLVTARRGVAIGITTADCAPVLFADVDGGVIGAAHAGWRGALGGVTDEVVSQMEVLGGKRERIAAAVGPTISPTNYEVGPEFREAFVLQNPAHEHFFGPSERPDHFMFDLPGYLEWRLKCIGLGTVERLGLCTYADEERFFSYRRTTHRKEETYGCQLSAITLGPDAFLMGN